MSDATKETPTEKLSGIINAHYVLLVVENRLLVPEKQQAWSSCPEVIRGIIRKYGIAKTLADNCWPFHLEKHLPTFVAVAHELQAHELTYRVLFFSDEPQWTEFL